MESGDAQIAGDEALSIDFRRYFLALRRYAWLLGAIVLVSICAAVIYTKRQTPIYEAVASVQIEPKLPDLIGTGDLFNVATAGTGAVEYYKQQRLVIGSYTMCQQTIVANDLISKLVSERQAKELSHEAQLDLATRHLMEQIDVRYPEANRIMYVAIKDADPKFARDLANEHVTTYVNYAKGLLSLNSNEASTALQQEFDDAEAKLREIEGKILKFEADNEMIAMTLEEHQNLVAANILSFTQKLNDARAEEIRLAAKLAEMRKLSTADVLANPVVMMGDNPSFETLRAQYYTEHSHLLELEKDLGPKNSEYLAQKQKVDELYKALEGEVKIIVDGTEDLYNAQVGADHGLALELQKYKDEAKGLSPKIVAYNDLMRDKRGIEDKYNILRARLSATQMTSGVSSSISNVRPLDPAGLPSDPVSPNLRMNVLVAGVLSLLVGIAFILLTAFLDRSIKSTNDATVAAGVASLGIIPMLSDAKQLSRDDERARDRYVHDHPTSHIAECCRTLRTNLVLSAADKALQAIVVCSPNKGEGKTTSVMYLGTTMAQSHQRVLLIDTDLRRPRLHTATGVARQRGLSNLIVGEDSYDDVIKETDIPNLYVLPCGPLPPNPAELLMTKRFETVLAELRRRFDRIILDSPPLPYTDAVVLSTRADGVILVVRAGRTLREELKRSSRAFRDVGSKVIGVIVNEIDHRNTDASYYYYSYYGPNDEKQQAEAG
ncbi:MAG TPA: polysaccharide biosynthesis tyrosine autokinase [Kofleriaceae bacterium]|nr:polysaccharide biosynthesis tyrosine autokinase [Kofleriaceae bacterium]